MPVFLYGWVESVALEEREEKRHPLNKGMPCKEADGLKRELTLERERERERPRASQERCSYTVSRGKRLAGWLHLLSDCCHLAKYACSKKDMQRPYLRIIMLYFYRLKKNGT